MFRQKMTDVTNCSCRLIPNQSDEYMIFKTQNSNAKPLNKEPKQKFSLKTQTASSNKHQNKVTSAQKTSLKVTKPYQDQKISISGNIEPKIQKLQKNLICSPENSQVRKLDQNIILFSKPSCHIRNFTTMQNSVKTAQNNKIRQQQNTNMNSHNNQHPRNQLNKDIFVSNFGNQKSTNSRETYSKASEIPKKSLNFDQYYKYVSNPYAANEKNKENVCFGDNSQVSRYKIDLKVKKQHRKLRNQALPLQQISNKFQHQIFHESLEKYQNRKQNIRETQKTMNSMSSESDSMKMSTNPISLLNSKIINFQQNPSLQFSKFNDQCQFDEYKTNQSEVFTQRNYGEHVNQVGKNNFNGNLLTQVLTHRTNYADEFAPKTLNTRRCQQIQRAYQTLQHSKVDNFNHYLVNSAHNQPRLYLGLNLKPKIQPKGQKVIIQKINTFTDFINNTAQCESLVGEGDLSYNENQQSVVIMRYKDLVQEIQGFSQFEPILLKSENLQVGSKYDKIIKENSIDSMQKLTNTTFVGKLNSMSNHDNSTIFNQNMKKTVKVNKGYSTHSFSTLQ